jgi:putative PIN family toxin of toxin-antitoxin system
VRIVLDTNVLVAAFVARGQCHELLEHLSRSHRLLTSEAILEEFREKLLDKIKAPPDTVEETVELERSRMEIVTPEPLPEPVCRDPDDDAVLATALAAKADCLITGDKDLLDLETFQGILILQPADFWKHESRLGQRAGRESADDQ